MDKLQVSKKVFDFQLNIFEMKKEGKSVPVDEINSLLLMKRAEYSSSRITISISMELLSVKDTITGLSSTISVEKINKNFVIMVDLEKVTDVDVLSDFISSLQKGQSESKDSSKIAIILGSSSDLIKMDHFNEELIVPTVKIALDDLLMEA